MNNIKLIFNERLYDSYYDLLIQKLTEDTSKKHYIALKNDCIILLEENSTYYDNKEKNLLIIYDIYKSKNSYKIDKSVHGIYIYPSSDYRFYFLNKVDPVKSREKGLKHISYIILLRFYQWNIYFENKSIDLLPYIFQNTNVQDYLIKPNTTLSVDDNHNDVFVENVNLNEIKDKFKSSLL